MQQVRVLIIPLLNYCHFSSQTNHSIEIRSIHRAEWSLQIHFLHEGHTQVYDINIMYTNFWNISRIVTGYEKGDHFA
jgi:hypothetical protein